MARRRHRFEKAPKFRGAAYIWLLIAILISASVWGVSARYIHQREQDILAKAKKNREAKREAAKKAA